MYHHRIVYQYINHRRTAVYSRLSWAMYCVSYRTVSTLWFQP